ncbi:MAG: TAT-variant-translocated molybdopterin oxidoreductase [bacterium]
MRPEKRQIFWRSLEEAANTKEFQERLQKEFPQSPLVWEKPFSRRNFLKLMGASVAFAGLHACTRQPIEKIYPYVKAPEEMIPGKPLFFATAFTLGGYATGVLVESHEGRPTKIEGNPDHPASLGATDIFAQASVLELYDPDRSQAITHLGRISAEENFLAAVRTELQAQRLTDGAGLRILTETVTSPTLTAQINRLMTEYPLAKWHQYEPVNRDNAKAGAQAAFGKMVETRYDFAKADVILSLDADFLTGMPGCLRYTRDFTAKRNLRNQRHSMNRLYAVESTPTLTGAMADHRWSVRPQEVVSFALSLASELGISEENPKSQIPNPKSQIEVLARDLKKHRGAGLVVAGEYQPAVVHVLAHAINAKLGNVGKTVLYTEPVETNPVLHLQSLKELAADMDSGSVEMLVIFAGNPAFNAPVDLSFREKLANVKIRIHLSRYTNETSELCHWHIPQVHYLETWSDARAFDGTVSLIQPLIAPLYAGASAHELLALLNGEPGASAHDIVRDYWRSRRPDFEKFWRASLHDGVVAGSALPAVEMKMEERKWRIEDGRLKIEADPNPASILHPLSSNEEEKEGALAITFRPDPTIWDGRFANNAWLQECPKPLSKLTWDNAALVSPKTAEQHKLQNQDIVEITYQGRTLKAPVWMMPGHPENAVTLHFGYGRTRSGNLGSGTGFDAFSLQTSEAPWFGGGADIRKTGEKQRLATTQLHHDMEGRRLVRTAGLEEFLEHPHMIHEMGHEPSDDMTLYPAFEYKGYSWGMAVDLNKCIGCNACTVACQSENNIPVVGKEEVLNGREMHWIRVDRYYQGEIDNPSTYHQPVMCMHCENAPCEVVCPVGATLHSDEGLNEMVYNRCVGTRYCSNNCPYKVRRFNFYLYADLETPSLKMLRNPDVTVRTRGVMEKCTYCVQRINHARIEAKKTDRQIQDGELVTACQQVCPADAIVFGDINDPESRVSKLRADNRNYGILSELGTRPRTTYLAKIRNSHPEIEEASG